MAARQRAAEEELAARDAAIADLHRKIAGGWGGWVSPGAGWRGWWAIVRSWNHGWL